MLENGFELADESHVKIAPFPPDEALRIDYLKSLSILDSAPERQFDDLVRVASLVCQAPISVVSLIDSERQWFKAKVGIEACETARDYAFCAHAILEDKLLEVSDTLMDDRFADNPLVVGAPHIRFYAGMPLTNEQGVRLGTICVIDDKPRQLSLEQKEILEILARAVSSELSKKMLQISRDNAHVLNQSLVAEVNQGDQLLNSIAEQVPGVIYQYQLFPDGRSCFPYASEGIKKIYEVDPAAVQQDAALVLQRIYPEDYLRVMSTISQSAKDLTLWDCSYRVNLPKAGLRWLHGNAMPKLQPDKSVVWHGFITDISERKNMEHHLQLASKMSTLGEISAGIAHEINNPLSVILGRAQFAKSQLEKGPVEHEKLVATFLKIEETTQRIAKIVKGLKTFSRTMGDEKFEKASLNNVIQDSIELCADRFRQKGVELRKPDLLDISIECRSVQVTQILVVLINNAFDAIKDDPSPWVAIEVNPTPENVEIRVTDCGLGIPSDLVEQIMNPFFTTKPVGEGTGLGLSIAQGIAREHGGSLSYKADSPHTCFSLILPLKQPEQAEKLLAQLPATQLLKVS